MLVMDIGNSRIKWLESGIDGRSSVESEAYKPAQLAEQLKNWFGANQHLSSVIVCSVATNEVNKRVLEYFEDQNIRTKFISVERTKAGVINAYKDVKRMGVDRWVAMVSADNKYQTAVCVIDAGTAVTIDVVDDQGHHQGGLIMPGLNLMRESLRTGTANISECSNSSLILANNTADAVSAGCYQLMTAGIPPIIERIEKKFSLKLLPVITGGDAEYVIEQTDCGMVLDKWLILDGLEQYFAD